MNSLGITFSEFVLGSGIQHLAFQCVFLIVASLISIFYVIKTRIGNLDAIIVTSYSRFCIGLLVCNAVGLVAYHLLLLINPNENWQRSLLYGLGFLLSYPIYGISVTIPGWAIGRGKDLRVITSRYKPDDQPKWFINLTENYGESAQIVPRGAIFAYQWLIFLSIVALSVNRLGG